MTREDVDRLFELLALYRPKDWHLKDKPTRAVWRLTLEPYTPADVKQAVAAYFRESKYWPDPSDISMRCPQKPDEMAIAGLRKEMDWMDKFLAKHGGESE